MNNSPSDQHDADQSLGSSSHLGLLEAIEHAKHFLPAQGPISVFVHHNTLHAFETLPFEEAVLQGSRMFNCEPYLGESQYRKQLVGGRIRVEDLQAVLMDDLGDDADKLILYFGSRYALRLAMLRYPLPTASATELRWMIVETDALQAMRSDVEPMIRSQMINQTRQFTMRHIETSAQQGAGNTSVELGAVAPSLQSSMQKLLAERGDPNAQSWSEEKWTSFMLELLWATCLAGAVEADIGNGDQELPTHHRDLLLQLTGDDVDDWINPILIRFCAAYVDQGFAAWRMPDREQGFAKCFALLYSQPFSPLASWMKGARADLRRIATEAFDPVESIAQSLHRLGVVSDQWTEYLTATMLSLRGWAGMLWQMESNAPWTPHPAATGTLLEYVAIRLLLFEHACLHLSRESLGVSDLGQIQVLAKKNRPRVTAGHEQQAFTIFQLSQLRGWTPHSLAALTTSQWHSLVSEIEAFSSIERRRVFHQAYERRYRHATLDAVAVRCGKNLAPHFDEDNHADYQVICCIDDREESFRRHLEECDPRSQTFGAAGFYAVAMYYQGAADAHYRPLCPIVITPQHYVREEPLFSAEDDSRRRMQRRQFVGRLSHHVHAGSRTMIGGTLTGLFGSLATFPMVARILAPGITARIKAHFGGYVSPPSTELHIERIAETPGPSDDAMGYSVAEMAGIVTRILQDIGLVKNFSPIILFLGHGSSSLNNPHESAYNCGACSGGRGGPNARAFATMANDQRVRKIVAENGIEIPIDVRFVGGYHNTCSDQVDYYDLDQLPRSHRRLFRRIEHSINEARSRNAHERSRRFELAPTNQTFAEALQHVQQRSEDLSQARPEYNHATNALCFVGKRDWSRGLYLDRRAFLTSYDPSIDDQEASILARILDAAIPVCAGISLEYYFSTVDPEGYGCGSKLPHNIASLAGVMTGAASDLRPGLSQQMIEIHEPLRILFVIETTPQAMLGIIARRPVIRQLVDGRWVQLAVVDPETQAIQIYDGSGFETYHPEAEELPIVESSLDWYRGLRDHLGFALIKASGPDAAVDRSSELAQQTVPSSQPFEAGKRVAS